jgi:hypothetical protein
MNKVLMKNKHHLTRIDVIFDLSRGENILKKIDMMFGYHQIRIKDEDISKTTFRDRYGHCELVVCHLD